MFWRAFELLWALGWLALCSYVVYRVWVGRRMAQAMKQRRQQEEWRRAGEEYWKKQATKPEDKPEEKSE